MSAATAHDRWVPSRDDVLQLGVCGLGSIGRRHLRLAAARSDVQVHAYDPAYDGHDPIAADGYEVIVETSFERLLAGAPDGVIIATPDATHSPLTQQACRAGVAVLVEKPVADSVVAAHAMERTAEQTSVPVLVGHVLRHMRVVQRARQLLDAGAIGTPVSFHATLGAYETLELARMRLGEPQSFRLAFDYTHEWDYLRHLLGPITRCAAVASTGGDLPLLERPNVIDAVLELERGTTGTVHLDYVERDGARTARIVGDRGVMVVDLRAGSLTMTGGDQPDRVEQHAEERDAMFARQLDHFVEVVRGRVEPLVPIGEARRALAVAEAIRSACEQATWETVETA
jgi:predicted dehydrogenase